MAIKPTNPVLADRTVAAVVKLAESNKAYPHVMSAKREWRFVESKQILPDWMFEQCIERFTRAMQ